MNITDGITHGKPKVSVDEAYVLRKKGKNLENYQIVAKDGFIYDADDLEEEDVF